MFYCLFPFTEAVKAAIVTSIIWLLFSITINFILSPTDAYAPLIFCGALFLGIPIVNHIGMLFAIRRHNRQIGDAVATQQMLVLLKREKKVAMDMWIVAVILLASLIPPMSMKFFEMQYPQVHAIALPWSLTGVFMTSSINPSFYLTRNPDLKNSVKSLINI